MPKTAIVLTLYAAGGVLLALATLPTALAGAALAAVAVALSYGWKV
jgi:hypothetical protein